MTHPLEIQITRARAIRYHMPLKRAYGTARGVTRAAVNFLVQLTATHGDRVIEGVGECQPRHALTGDGGKDRSRAWGFLCAATDWLHDHRLRFSDRDEAIAAVRETMAALNELATEHADDSNRDRPYRGTLLGIEVALLDVVSRLLSLQIAELLGKQRDEIGISISTISSSTGLEEVPGKVLKQVRFPMTRVKGVGDIAYDVALLETVARANRSADREKPLWIDINEALDFNGAAELIRQVAERMGNGTLPAALVIEGILPKAQVVDLPQLQRVADEECRSLAAGRSLDLRIMPDEGLWDVDDFRQLSALGGCRAINIKAPKAGGLLASLDLANAAVAADPDVHICIGGMVGTSDITAWALHNLARALPRVDYLTTVPPQNVRERISEPLARYHERGSNIIAAQTTPGLGAQLRQDKLAPYVDATHDTSTDETDRLQSAPPARVTEEGTGGAVADATGTTRTLVFGGDTSLADVYVNRQGGELKQRLHTDPMSFLAGLEPLVADHDALILNLETVLADAPTSPFEGRKSYLGWDTPDRTIDCLRTLGVDAVGLANNHTMDFGPTHLLATKEKLEQAGVSTFGAGVNQEEATAPLTIPLDFDGTERRVHIIGAMQLQAKLRDEFQFYAGSKRPGVNSMAVSRTSAAIERLRTADPTSLIIVFPHWGRNYQWVNDSQQRAAEAFVRAGADLIIGHGAHMLQQCAFGKRHAVVYSLGNFQFNWGGRFDKYEAPPFGLVARVVLAYQKDRWNVSLRLYPILIDNRATGHRPAPVDEQGFDSVWRALTAADLDQSFQREARSGRDTHGRYISFAFETSPQVTTGGLAPPGQVNTYDDPESVELLGKLNQRLLSSLLIAREAERDGATIEWLASDTFLATAGKQRLLFKGNRCTESVPASKAVRDKALLKELLEQSSVRTPAGGRAHSLEEATAIAEHVGWPVVVKPCRGDRGDGVTAGVSNRSELTTAYERALSAGGRVLVEQFAKGAEYRCLATARDCIGVIGREAPNVVGDGRHTVEELITLKNAYRRRNPNLQKGLIAVDEHLVRFLARSGLGPDSIPGEGQKVYLGGAANFTIGGDSIDCADAVPDVVKQTAVAAVRAVPGLNWGGVDVIVVDGEPGTEPTVFVLEINVNAGISSFHYPMYGKPRNIAREVWQLRLSAVPSSPSYAALRRGMRRVARPVEPHAALPVGSREHQRVELGSLLAERLRSANDSVTQLGPRLMHVRAGSETSLYYGGTSTDDLATVLQVVSRRAMLRRVLRLAGVRTARGQAVRSTEELQSFLAKVDTPVALLPVRGESDQEPLALLNSGADDATLASAWDRAGGVGPFFVQARPAGTRLRVLATREAAWAVLTRSGGAEPAAVAPSVLEAVQKHATEAVCAVPELRWAAVDLLLPGSSTSPGKAVVEGLTMAPTFSPDDYLLAGSIDDFLTAILGPGENGAPASGRGRRWLRRLVGQG